MQRATVLGMALVLLAGFVVVATGGPASGHASAMLNGRNAFAGERGVLTMRIPHGCNGNLATDQVRVRFSKQWKAAPKSLQGWKKQKLRGRNGRTIITWSATGTPLAADAVGDFRMRVRYPGEPGLYATPTIQVCGDVKSRWTEPDRGGATADHPYPSDYPVPKIKVLSR